MRRVLGPAIAFSLLVGALVPGRIASRLAGKALHSPMILVWLAEQRERGPLTVAVVGADCTELVSRSVDARFHWGGAGRERLVEEFDAAFLVVPHGARVGAGVELAARDLDGFDVYRRTAR